MPDQIWNLEFRIWDFLFFDFYVLHRDKTFLASTPLGLFLF